MVNAPQCAYSSQNLFAVLGANDRVIRIFDASFTQILNLTRTNAVGALGWNSNGSLLAFAEVYGVGLSIWNIVNNTV